MRRKRKEDEEKKKNATRKQQGDFLRDHSVTFVDYLDFVDERFQLRPSKWSFCFFNFSLFLQRDLEKVEKHNFYLEVGGSFFFPIRKSKKQLPFILPFFFFFILSFFSFCFVIIPPCQILMLKINLDEKQKSPKLYLLMTVSLP